MTCSAAQVERLCAELGVHPHRLQLGEHLGEEAGLGVDPQHRAAAIINQGHKDGELCNLFYI